MWSTPRTSDTVSGMGGTSSGGTALSDANQVMGGELGHSTTSRSREPLVPALYQGGKERSRLLDLVCFEEAADLLELLKMLRLDA